MNAVESPSETSWAKIILVALVGLIVVVVGLGFAARAIYQPDDKPFLDEKSDISTKPEDKARFCDSAIPERNGMLMTTRVGDQRFWIAIIPDKAPTQEIVDLAQRINGEIRTDPAAAAADAASYDDLARSACQ